MTSRWWFFPLVIVASLGLVAAGVVTLVMILLYPTLPNLDALIDYRPKLPLVVLSAEGELIAEFGEEKRSVVSIDEVPTVLKQAVLAAEDERFYNHSGVDSIAVLRAIAANLSGGKRQGGGTITMQLARDVFLSREKTMARKISEAMLAIKIEKNLSKDQILELYMNQIFLGQRSYGFAAAAQAYFAKDIKDLTLSEASLLAGLLPAPSRYNPFAGTRWQARQRYVLGRMLTLGMITPQQQEQALAEKLSFSAGGKTATTLEAEYVAEMARQFAVDQYGDAAMVSGLRVHTTIKKIDQEAANAAIKRGIIDYDRRHGYRGAEGFVDLAGKTDTEEGLDELLQDREVIADLEPAIVLEMTAKTIKIYTKRGETLTLSGDALKNASKSIADKTSPERIRRGSIIRIADDKVRTITQLPKVEAAFVSISPKDGAIASLAGGFDYTANKFNHVTQAMRQPGSSFKPFIYSAALEKGFTAASVINDAPIVIEASKTGSGESWEPKNYDGKFDGPMRFRTALTKSKNMVSIRIMQTIGPKYAQDFITRFGFAEKDHPAYLTMALGAGSTTPLQMATAYAVFANGGYRIKPYFVQKITDARGETLYTAKPEVAGETAERVLDQRNAFIMSSIMRDVVSYGTATRALALGRKDLAGKTGTTNDHLDAWFAGFQPTLVGIAWIGFDNPTPLGADETGGKAALPIWINYMAKALKDVPNVAVVVPAGVIQQSYDGRSEYFLQENLPRAIEPIDAKENRPSEEVKSQIF